MDPVMPLLLEMSSTSIRLPPESATCGSCPMWCARGGGRGWGSGVHGAGFLGRLGHMKQGY